MATNIEILTQGGIQNASALVSAASATGVPLHIAAAVAQKESNGRNIYGHDTGGTFYGKGAVTEANYRQFYDLVVNQGRKSNGVGPMQITYRGYFPQAAKEGYRLWIPLDNFKFGLRIIKKSLGTDYSNYSIQKAGTLYNAGNLNGGITEYGRDLARKAAVWKTKLAPAPAPAPVLQRGSDGEAVRKLQDGLNRVFPSYSNLVEDGKFGPATEAVVKEFQSRVAFYADGIVDTRTRAKLGDYGITF